MIAKKSPLILNNFLLLKFKYQFINPTEEGIDILKVMEQYFIEVDYVFQSIDDEHVQLFTKIEINNNKENFLAGYKIFIEGACIFSFDKDAGLSENDKASLLHISGISISINSLRNVIATITANGPFGKYNLPTVDVNQLLADKNQMIKTQKEKQEK